MHYVAFAITDVNIRISASKTPVTDIPEVQEAAKQAINMALAHIKANPDVNYPESLGIGSYQAYRLIQGQHGADRPESASFMSATDALDYTSQFWSQLHDVKHDHHESFAHAVDRHWNNSSELVRLALRPTAPHIGRGWTPVVPDITLFTDREAVQFLEQRFDVFGEGEDAVSRPNIASRYIDDVSHAAAHRLATTPMRDLQKAKHRIAYIQDIAPYRDQVVIQLAWNL